MYKYVLFDLDGTLTDSAPGIKNSVIYALDKFGIKATHEELDCFIGPPLVDSFMEYYGFSKEDADKAVVFYREYFSEKGIFQNEVYEGVPEVLAELKNSGAKLALATSKPKPFADRILKHFDLEKYFDVVCGATFDGNLSKKGDIVRLALEELGANKDESILVGDRKHDVYGAHENGIPCLAVLYGYGDRQELEACHADFITDKLNLLSFKKESRQRKLL